MCAISKLTNVEKLWENIFFIVNNLFIFIVFTMIEVFRRLIDYQSKLVTVTPQLTYKLLNKIDQFKIENRS